MQRRTFIFSLASSLSAGLSWSAEASPTVLGMIEYGQSNSEGQAMKSAAVLHTDYPKELRMPETASGNVWLGQATVGGRSFEADAVTGLAPLRGTMGSASHGTTAGESMVLRLVAPVASQSGRAGQEIVLFNVAEGGQAIRNLAQDAKPQYFGFRNLKRVTEAVNAALQREHKRYVVPVVIMAQGESDAKQRRLGPLQEQVRSEIESTIREITGQREPVWLLTVQPSSFQANSEGVCSILAQHELSLTRGGSYFCLGPTYNFPFAYDFLHSTSQGHDMRGELYAVAYQTLQREGRWDVLRAISAKVVQPNQILVKLSEAAEVEHLDTSLPLPRLGVDLTGGDIVSVQVENDGILITTEGPAASVQAVRFGLDGHGEKRSAETIPRTSIRSSAAYGRYRNGTAIRKWLCHQELELAGPR